MYRDMNENQKVNILIVDDKANNIFALEQMLAKPERTFISTTDGVEALKIALNRDIDLMILDVQMPGMNGFEVTQILKTNKRTRDIPIIFASAERKEHEFVMKGFEEGGIDYLYKPLDPKITEAKVSVLLRLHLQKKELIAKNATLEKYALLINNSADLICIINAKTFKFEEINDAATIMLGYATEDLKDTSLLFYLSEEDQLKVQKFSKGNKEKFSFETQFCSKNESIKWLHWNVVNKNGLWFGNARDITQQKESEQEIKQLNSDLKRNITQLESTNKELESFSYSVSHDLRAPLRAINGYCQIIQEEHESQFDDELRRLFGIIQKNSKRMGVLIDDLLAFSRLGKRELSKVPINFNDLVHAVINELHYPHHKNIQFNILPLASTDGDYNLLFQVITNLISNAIKYSSKRENPKIEIGSIEREEEFIYYIKDNGVGFNMDYAHKLFGVFQRLHSNEEFEGTGVGLANVQRIITKHGGKVWAEGDVDKGATFYFSLPKPLTSL
jgi:PAS domain S-box-containing protein